MTEQWRRISENLKKSLDSGVFKVWIAPLAGSVDGNIVRLASQSAYAANWLRDRLGDQLRQAAAPVLGIAEASVELDIRVETPSRTARSGGASASSRGGASAPFRGGSGALSGVPLVTPSPALAGLVAPGAATQRASLPGLIASGAAPQRASLSGLIAPGTAPQRASLPGLIVPGSGAACDTVPPACDHMTREAEAPLPVQGHLPVGLPPVTRWRYSFDDFVVGPTNAVAVAAAQDLCLPRPSVETLFVSAQSGLGKTHLIHAVGQCLCQGRREAQVGYLTAEEFTSRFVLASRTHQMDNFKASLRDLDVLLLDDVHFFQGKEKTQDEALSTIKCLQARGSRVVLTSSFAPRDLRNVDSQLVSHFSSGLLANIQKPTVDMRRDMLTRKAKVYQVLLPEPVADLLARRLNNDIRQLESCLNNLIFKARHLNRQICLELALDVLGQYATEERALDVESIIRLVCESYGLAPHQLTSRSRRHEYVLARNTIYYLSRKHTELSLQEIGERFNRRHSTVIKGITALERELQRGSVVGRQVANTVQLIERNAGI